jgi:hypothetical protein
MKHHVNPFLIQNKPQSERFVWMPDLRTINCTILLENLSKAAHELYRDQKWEKRVGGGGGEFALERSL